MYKIANSDSENRRILFNKIASDLQISPLQVEKDFWITIVLDYLFNKCKYKDLFVFKGGTCLSKCYKIINRFSEDIDIVLSWGAINLKTKDVMVKRGSKPREKFKSFIREKTSYFISNKLIPEMKNDLENLLNEKIDIVIDPVDSRNVFFKYPNLFSGGPTKPIIKLEIGCLSSIEPNNSVNIESYVSQCESNIIVQPKSKVLAITPESIFWEKVLILHQLSSKTKIGERLSRHYYDLACLYNSKVKDNALTHPELFVQALNMTQTFYYLASLNELKINDLNLIPNNELLNELEKDYEITTKEMILDTKKPEFKQIIESIKLLQAEIKKLSF